MTWFHVTTNKIKYIKTNFDQSVNIKPNGLWCSYKDEWIKWCKNEGFSTFDTDNYYLYELVFNPEAKILTIDSLEKYMSLEKYRVVKHNLNIFDWNKIKIDYDGVAFLNYHKIKSDMLRTKKIDSLILSLDINSCCVWNHVYKLNFVKHYV